MLVFGKGIIPKIPDITEATPLIRMYNIVYILLVDRYRICIPIHHPLADK